MERREPMAMSGGSAQYYIHSSHSGSTNVGAGSAQLPHGFRPLSSPLESNIVTVAPSGGPTFGVEPSRGNVNTSMTMSVAVAPSGTPSTDPPMKKKRGRPRKYAPDGSVNLGLSPMSATPKAGSSGLGSSSPKKRGRPSGSGRKQILASIGGWMYSSAGQAFAPHVIHVSAGEDIAAKLLLFAQQRPRALCILSGTGTVSLVTLRQPASSAGTVRYEGLFEILCLSGSYLVSEEGGHRNRSGGISVSLSTPGGHVIGGAVAALIAASPVQVVGCSFLYGGSRIKDKEPDASKDAEGSEKPQEKSNTPSAPTQNYTPAAGVWPGSRSADQRDPQPHTNIDLTSG